MADNLDKQIQQYQLEFQKFLAEIDDGTFEGDLDMLREGFNQSSVDIQRKVNEQTTAYKNKSPDQSVVGFINFLGRTTANSFLGPVGLSYQDFQNPERLAVKAKKTAIQSAMGVVSQNVKNPARAILNRIKGRDRNGASKEDIMSRNDAYKDRVDQRRILQDPLYRPESYEEQHRTNPDFKDSYDRIKIIHNNQDNSFYTNYKILHEERDEEFNDGLDEYLIKFHIRNDDKVLIFRMANFSGLTDAFQVGYEDVRYFGRPESLKQYSNVSRNITFTFDVHVDIQSDIYPVYKKLDILAGLCYPNSYTNDNIVQPNIVELSIGKYLNKMPFFITSLSFQGDDEQVFSEGKPRLITVSVTGDLVQPEANPQLNKYGDFNTFVNRDEIKPQRYVVPQREADAAVFDNIQNESDNRG